MDLVEYVFGTGEGDPHGWVSSTDLDLGGGGDPDAVWLDFDGDGLRDDALWDRDGDGVADHSVLDVGSASARYFTDADGSGTWAVEVADPERPGSRAVPGSVEPSVAEQAGVGPPAVDRPAPDPAVREPAVTDPPGEDTVDTDGDGRVDAMLVPWGRSTQLHVDTDGDGVLDLQLEDADGDGRLDRPVPDASTDG